MDYNFTISNYTPSLPEGKKELIERLIKEGKITIQEALTLMDNSYIPFYPPLPLPQLYPQYPQPNIPIPYWNVEFTNTCKQ